MANGTPPNDEERLPWLEPYRETQTGQRPPEAEPKRRDAGLAVGVVAAIGAALTGGYYIGQREQAPEPTVVAEAPVTTRPAPVAEMASAAEEPTSQPVETALPSTAKADPTELPPMAEPSEATSGPLKRNRDAARERALRNFSAERSRLRAIRFAQEQAAADAVAAANARPATQDTRNWPKMPSPGPAGQVVQLGAFRTEGRALAAYRLRLSRYPVMASMPRVVVPVITKPRGQVLYVLRLGTASRQQSRVVCRNLRASGDHCIVIG